MLTSDSEFWTVVGAFDLISLTKLRSNPDPRDPLRNVKSGAVEQQVAEKLPNAKVRGRAEA